MRLNKFLFLTFVACFASAPLLAEHAESMRRQHPRRRYQFEPPLNQTAKVEFSYRHAFFNPDKNAIPIKMMVTDPAILKEKEKLFALVEYFPMKHSRQKKTVSLPIQWKGNDAYVSLDGLESNSVYRAQVKLYKKRESDPSQGDQLRDLGEFIGVTSGDTHQAKARHRIVTSELIEADDWRARRTNHTNMPYEDLNGGWCGSFQEYCTKPFLKIDTEQPSKWYERHGKLASGSDIPALAAKDGVHGDWANYSYHKLMILDYDHDTQTVHSIDGNSGAGSGVAFFERPTSAISLVGHITDDTVKTDGLWVQGEPPAVEKK